MSASPEPAIAPLRQDLVSEFPYKHSTGEVIGRFLAGLKEQKRIWGQRVAGQGVVVPPFGYSEIDGSAAGEWVEVKSTGTVTAVAVVQQPIERLHPFAEPFAFVLVRLDGADTAMAHVVKDDLARLRVGSRVAAVWKPDGEREGSVRDISCFRVTGEPTPKAIAAGAEPMNEPPKEPVKYVQTDVHLPYHYVAGDHRARYLQALKDKRILGSKCSQTGRVLLPPMINSAESFAPADQFVDVSDKGVVTTFCIVNIPVIGRNLEIPYVAASVALDGADLSIFALIQECKPEEVRMGMRVEAVWKPDGERQGDHEDILYFRPTGERDAPAESYINRL